MRQNSDAPFDTASIKLAGVVAAGLLMAVTIMSAIRLQEALRPRNGDIIAFDPTRPPRAGELAFTVGSLGRPNATSCVLDARVMQRSGGSLVIEATWLTPTLHYRVHWIGGPTSSGTTDCGGTADLRLDPSQVVTLAVAAGGFASDRQ
ncbi:MAG TPA: hypothetical protein VFE41_08490 [Acetobacteraceae bacterium]|jgi:hypothetical protein|nr:hypothetical protein [Acetobacteraceae bacterium]HTC09484.1 hypothetical protein [Acetobacteraceae bacterium]